MMSEVIDVNKDKEVNDNVDEQVNEDLKDNVNNDLKVNDDANQDIINHNDEDPSDDEPSDGNDDNDLDYEVNEDNFMLSTIDNPYSPKTEYDMWKRWDNDHGYDTEEYIGRLVSMEEDFEPDDEFILNMLTTKVINDILENDDTNLYRLV